MKTKTNIKQIALTVITIFLIILWTMVSLEKFITLEAFHKSLLKQPFPSWWSDVLYWLLPILEIGVVLFLLQPKKEKLITMGMWLSAILMLSFTIFIGLGVLGVYPKEMCGCSFYLRKLSHTQHLHFNGFFLILSLLGIWLSKSIYNQEGSDKRNYPKDPDTRSRKPIRLWWDPRVVSEGKLKKLLSFRMIFNFKKYALYWRNARR